MIELAINTIAYSVPGCSVTGPSNVTVVYNAESSKGCVNAGSEYLALIVSSETSLTVSGLTVISAYGRICDECG